MGGLRVFVASTADDLKEYRKKVADAILRLGNQPVQAEYFSALPKAPVDACRQAVIASDTLVTVVAHRYGWVPKPEDGGDGKKSITWIEVETALQAGKPVFSFIVDPSLPWERSKEQDRLTQASTAEEALQIHERVQALLHLKSFLEARTTRATFTTSDELAQLVVTSLVQWLNEHGSRPAASENGATVRRWSPRVVHALQPSPHFHGRESILEGLDAWWADPASPERVISLVAPGGTGKTAVTERFLRHVLSHPRNAGVFVWSFYEAPEVDRFLREALEYFGGERAGDAGGRLSRLQVKLSDGCPHFLILDGLESVQAEGGGKRPRGELEDQALRLLVRSLAAGLGNAQALVTSRFPLVDLEDWRGCGYDVRNLPDLESDAALSVLNEWGVRGDEETLDALVAQFGGHALSISVLGSYLGSFAGGDASKAASLQLDRQAEDDPRAAKLQRILAAYANVLSDPERKLMAVLATFPRGVSVDLLRVGADAVGSESDFLKADDQMLTGLLLRLQKLGLVFDYLQDGKTFWSAHPFLRQYFARLPDVDTARVREAVGDQLLGRLESRPRVLPRDLSTLDRYERVIENTRLSGKTQDAFDVYWHALGRYNHLGASLGEYTRGARILASFAEHGDPSRVAADIPDAERAALVSDWGHFNKDLGDLSTARLCHWEALSIYQKLHEWKNLAGCRVNIADIEIRAGQLDAARNQAEEAVALANVTVKKYLMEPIEPPDRTLRIVCTGTLAKVQHLLGETKQARTNFDRALNLTGGMPEPILLRQRAEWLRDLGRIPEAQASARMSLAANERHGWQRDVARIHALLGQMILSTDLSQARRHLATVRSWCDRTGDVGVILDARLLAAQVARATGDLETAGNEASMGLELAVGCGFVLNQVQFNIEMCRIDLTAAEFKAARPRADSALKLASGSGCGFAWGTADALRLRGIALQALGEITSARQDLEEAERIMVRLEHPELAATRNVLNSL